MVGKLILLLMACDSTLAAPHIVTSSAAHSELAFLSCVSSLSEVVQTTLCPMYGQVGQYSMEAIMHPGMDPREAESRIWEFRNHMKRCCTRPCSLSELVAVC